MRQLAWLLSITLFEAGCASFTTTWTEERVSVPGRSSPVTVRTSNSKVAVAYECRRAGVDLPYDAEVLGCADFAGNRVIAVRDDWIIAHELCHFRELESNGGDPEHRVCIPPLSIERFHAADPQRYRLRP
jgi:hypothetical protein